MKKIILLSVVAIVFASCTKMVDRVKKDIKYPHGSEIEINGHNYYMPMVGQVSGQSNGYVCQLVHDPDCERCAVVCDSTIRSIIREELRIFGDEVE